MEQLKYSQEDDRLHVEPGRQIRLEMAGLVDCPRGWRGKPHSHPFWEFVFIGSGEGVMRMQGRLLPLRRGDLLLLPPLAEHQFVNTGRDKVENLYVGFGFEGRSPAAADGPILLGPAGELLLAGLRGLSQALRGQRAGSSLRNQALAYEILYRALEQLEGHPELAPRLALDRDQILAERARKYLESNIHRTVSVEEVAAKFFLSPHYFARKFKSEIGMGIKEWHNRARMEKAVELLRDPMLTVSEVAAKLGFANANYFTNRFREHFGKPPGLARRPPSEAFGQPAPGEAGRAPVPA